MNAFSFTDRQYDDHVAAVEATLEQLRVDNVDSRSLYGRVVGDSVVWSAERRAAQRKVVHELWDAQVPTATRNSRVVLLAGVPGAGKTTVRRNPENGFTTGYVIIDPDEIAEAMVERGLAPAIDALSPMETCPLLLEEAWEIGERLSQRAYQQRCDVLWEITLSVHPRDRIDLLKMAGYRLHGGFVETPIDLARERTLVRHRQAEEDYRNGIGHGGLLIPSAVHEICRPTSSVPYPAMYVPAKGEGVRVLLDRFEAGDLAFDDLVATVVRRWQDRGFSVEKRVSDAEQPVSWGTVYRRFEHYPNDDDLVWISIAGDRGALTVEQADTLFEAVGSAAEADADT